MSVALGPRQQHAAKNDAEAVWLWSLDLVAAIAANDIDRATQLSSAIALTNARLAATLSRAKEVRA